MYLLNFEYLTMIWLHYTFEKMSERERWKGGGGRAGVRGGEKRIYKC